MQTLLHDIRYALRLLRKSPGFTVAAVLTLALGMGANTVMFSVLNTVLLRPLPYAHPDRLVQIWETDSRLGRTHGPVSAYNFTDWQIQSKTMVASSTYDYENVVLTGQKEPKRLATLFVTAGFFDVFEAKALKGRTFLPGEDEPGKDHVVVLSYGAWRRHFGEDANIIGKSIALDDALYAVMGIMPPDFAFSWSGNEAWCLPAFDLKKLPRSHHGLFAVGRLKTGVTLPQAQSEMNTIADRLARDYPGSNGTAGVSLVPLQEEIVGDVRGRLLVLWGAVIAVLLVACANVAGLLLARAVSRQKEVAIRTALGGTRARLVRQFLTESTLLALIGGIAGMAIALWAGRMVVLSSRGPVPRLRDLQLDGWVIAVAAAGCVVTGLLFGIAPALHALRADLNSTLKETHLTSSQSSGRLWLRSLFVVCELALALVLLVGAGLLTKTLWRMQHVDPGFEAENVLGARISVPQSRYPDGDQRALLYQRIVERLAAIPGVESAGATNDLPFSGSRSSSSFKIEGRPPKPDEVWQADYRVVSPAYMEAMHMRLIQGRRFSVHDNQDAPNVAIVSQAFAKKFFPDQDPLGHRIDSHGGFLEIVGVIGDAKLQGLTETPNPELYVPYLQRNPPGWAFLVVRSHTDQAALIRSVRTAVAEIVPDQPLYDLRSMNDRLSVALGPQRFTSLLLGVFAGLALLLAGIGVYGVIAYTVAQRTHEIGIRMALGATRADVLRLIFRQGARIAAIGLSVGTVIALITTRFIASLLFGVEAHDPLIFAGVLVALLSLVLIASYVPARRAAQVDPMVALRCE